MYMWIFSCFLEKLHVLMIFKQISLLRGYIIIGCTRAGARITLSPTNIGHRRRLLLFELAEVMVTDFQADYDFLPYFLLFYVLSFFV